MAAERKDAEDGPHVTSAELLEGSFVSVPSNREAAVLMAKEFDAKAGSRNSTKDSERLQTIHDLAVRTAPSVRRHRGSHTRPRDPLRGGRQVSGKQRGRDGPHPGRHRALSTLD
jgi:hypothetical protein